MTVDLAGWQDPAIPADRLLVTRELLEAWLGNIHIISDFSHSLNEDDLGIGAGNESGIHGLQVPEGAVITTQNGTLTALQADSSPAYLASDGNRALWLTENKLAIAKAVSVGLF